MFTVFLIFISFLIGLILGGQILYWAYKKEIDEADLKDQKYRDFLRKATIK